VCSLRATLFQVAARFDRKLVVADGVEGAAFVRLVDSTWDDALAALADAHRFDVARLAGELTVLAPPGLDVASPPASSPYERLDSSDASGPPAAGDGEVSAVDADLRELAVALGERLGKPAVAAADVREKVTLAVRGLPGKRAAELALGLAALQTRCRVVPIGGVLVLDQPPSVTIEIDDAPLRTVLTLLAAYAGKNVLVAADVRGDCSLALPQGCDWFAALRALAIASRLHVREVAPGVLGVSAAKLGPELVEAPVPSMGAWRAPGDALKVSNVTVEDADLGDLCAELGKAMNRQILVEPDVHEKVTTDLRSVDLRDALDVIAFFTKCTVQRRGDMLVLGQPPKLTFQATDAALRPWCQLVGRALGVEVAPGAGVSGSLTFDLHELSYEDALRVAALSIDARVERSANGLEVVRSAGAAPSLPPPPRRAPAPSPAAASSPEPLSPAQTAELDAQVEAIFVDLEKLAKEQKIEDLVPKFSELNQIMSERKRAGREAVGRKLEQWHKRLEEWKEIELAVALQVDLQEGNEHLRSMILARQRERWDDAEEAFRAVIDLAKRMRHREREEFHRNADAIVIRAKELVDEARKLKRIGERLHGLRVTAIEIDPRPEGKNRAILVLAESPEGQVYEEGDAVKDAAGNEAARVVKINEGSIKLKFEDVEFLRELATPE
jgi:hypothetical protein